MPPREIVSRVRLSKETDARVAECARKLGRTKHAIMVEAIERGLPAVERDAADWAEFKAKKEAEREAREKTARKSQSRKK